MEQQVQAAINFDAQGFFSNEQTISHQADKFVMDFKQIFAQFNPDNQPHVVINHRLVLIEPHVAKSFLNILQENIKRYEDKFGEIKVPHAVKQQKKIVEKSQKKKSTGTESSYFG